MNNILINAPVFHQTQIVRFMGGEGTVQCFRFDSGRWIYDIEMELGPEPLFGRVGPETTIVLEEEELCAVMPSK
jgi:hypothetical protein